MRIGHASISENGNNGRDGKAKAGDQTGKEVCIRSFYKKPWKYLLRCKDTNKAEIMAKACEAICQNPNVGYDQSQRLTLHKYLSTNGYNYTFINVPCECDCSSFMTVCAECAGIYPAYTAGNAPVTANMVKKFMATGYFELLDNQTYINNEKNLLRGDILVGPPNTHTVMVLDNGVGNAVVKRTLKRGMRGDDVKIMQQILFTKNILKYSPDGVFGPRTEKAVKDFQISKRLTVDGICGPKTWEALEK